MISQKKQPLALMLFALMVLFGTFVVVRAEGHHIYQQCELSFTCPVFDSTASGFSATGHEGGGFGGGGGGGFAITTGQGHKAGPFDPIWGWLVGKILDAGYDFMAEQGGDTCGNGPCGGGGGGGW